ncbi:xanthine dehydrogenase YagR molybdenum-binding subunit [Povalibacter uvarum]|uniref:Xanthine dehydrogenase YagR molybdenum-binding subunit n=1 Tax=Povalibacter uvarum TaxID=732238 RepID=A0A841HIL7_9GAMM|nr:xanthine dehydrogenase family protein molybdopterin-binding subunit [Povalibacter uvarum]MBB6092857.1 xanthine dehydrogenase YagR molybdenum-binding subunit [Povalibacter uvarum]
MSDPASSDRSVQYGIVGDALRDVVRKVPQDEPPPWPANDQLAVVGKPTPRLDARQKVTGQALYTFDVQLDGMLFGCTVSSTVAHARIRSIDTSKAERHPGVRAVHILDRVLMTASLRDPGDEAKQRYPTVRYLGQPIAGIAATSARAAREAASLVQIEYEPLPHVVSLEEARQPDAPMIFPGPTEQPATAGGGGAQKGLDQKGNLRGPATNTRGNVDQGFADAEVVVEREYRTQVQTHVPMETHGIVADWRDDELTLYASTQFTLSVRDEAVEIFGLDPAKVRVLSEFTGGGFGAKYGIGNYGALAIHLSRKARAPVRFMLDRREEHVTVGNRPATVQQLKIGAKRDGTLTAVRLRSFGTGGVAAGAGVGSCHSTLYACSNVSTEHYDVFTNAGPAAAFRGPGQVQGIFALEQAIDEIADKLGIDPIELRDRIDTRDVDDSKARKVERHRGAQRFGWEKRRPTNADAGPIKRGVGMAQSQWYYIVHKDTECEVRVLGDGTVQAFSSAQDIGTGTRTVFAQVIAEEFGLRTEEIDARIGDSRYPAGPPSGGSRVTSSLTPAARNAAYRAAQELAKHIAPLLGCKPGEVVFSGGKVEGPTRSMGFREAIREARIDTIVQRSRRVPDYEGYARTAGDFQLSRHGIGGVQFAQISVDTETGVVKVERVLAVHDCGRPINPQLVESQIYGGVIQGVSYALYEERHLDGASGVQLNANIDQYKIVGSRETPAIEVHLIEQLGGQSSTDARGVAEPANVATAAAIANAFFNATGKRILTLPLTPANVLAALRAPDERGNA